MSAWQRIVVAIAAALALASCTRAPQTAAEPETASAAISTEFEGLATVADGDTIRIGGRRIQLYGIETARQGSMCGALNVYRTATQELRDITGNESVQCTIADLPDGSGVHVARCRVDGADIGGRMVSAGWARSSGGVYAEEEAQARAARLGVWAQNCAANLWAD